jgi:hypothetical protein
MTDEKNVKFIMEFIKANRELAFYQIEISILIRPKLYESYLNILLRLSDDELNHFFVTSQVPDPIFSAIYNTGRVTKIRRAPKISGVFTRNMFSLMSSSLRSSSFGLKQKTDDLAEISPFNFNEDVVEALFADDESFFVKIEASGIAPDVPIKQSSHRKSGGLGSRTRNVQQEQEENTSILDGKCLVYGVSGAITYIEAAALYGAVKCFKFLLLNNVDTSNCASAALAGGSSEILHILEQNNFDFSGLEMIALIYRNDEIFDWLTKGTYLTNINCINANSLSIKAIMAFAQTGSMSFYATKFFIQLSEKNIMTKDLFGAMLSNEMCFVSISDEKFLDSLITMDNFSSLFAAAASLRSVKHLKLLINNKYFDASNIEPSSFSIAKSINNEIKDLIELKFYESSNDAILYRVCRDNIDKKNPIELNRDAVYGVLTYAYSEKDYSFVEYFAEQTKYVDDLTTEQLINLSSNQSVSIIKKILTRILYAEQLRRLLDTLEMRTCNQMNNDGIGNTLVKSFFECEELIPTIIAKDVCKLILLSNPVSDELASFLIANNYLPKDFDMKNSIEKSVFTSEPFIKGFNIQDAVAVAKFNSYILGYIAEIEMCQHEFYDFAETIVQHPIKGLVREKTPERNINLIENSCKNFNKFSLGSCGNTKRVDSIFLSNGENAYKLEMRRKIFKKEQYRKYIIDLLEDPDLYNYLNDIEFTEKELDVIIKKGMVDKIKSNTANLSNMKNKFIIRIADDSALVSLMMTRKLSSADVGMLINRARSFDADNGHKLLSKNELIESFPVELNIAFLYSGKGNKADSTTINILKCLVKKKLTFKQQNDLFSALLLDDKSISSIILENIDCFHPFFTNSIAEAPKREIAMSDELSFDEISTMIKHCVDNVDPHKIVASTKTLSEVLIKNFTALERKEIEYLLEAGADINYFDEKGDTPLFKAIFAFDYNSICYLIEKGAETGFIGKGCALTVLEWAVNEKENNTDLLSSITLKIAKVIIDNSDLQKISETISIKDTIDRFHVMSKEIYSYAVRKLPSIQSFTVNICKFSDQPLAITRNVSTYFLNSSWGKTNSQFSYGKCSFGKYGTNDQGLDFCKLESYSVYKLSYETTRFNGKKEDLDAIFLEIIGRNPCDISELSNLSPMLIKENQDIIYAVADDLAPEALVAFTVLSGIDFLPKEFTVPSYALLYAYDNEHYDICLKLIKLGAPQLEVSCCVYDSIRRGDMNFVKFALENGFDPNHIFVKTSIFSNDCLDTLLNCSIRKGEEWFDLIMSFKPSTKRIITVSPLQEALNCNAPFWMKVADMCPDERIDKDLFKNAVVSNPVSWQTYTTAAQNLAETSVFMIRGLSRQKRWVSQVFVAMVATLAAGAGVPVAMPYDAVKYPDQPQDHQKDVLIIYGETETTRVPFLIVYTVNYHLDVHDILKWSYWNTAANFMQELIKQLTSDFNRNLQLEPVEFVVAKDSDTIFFNEERVVKAIDKDARGLDPLVEFSPEMIRDIFLRRDVGRLLIALREKLESFNEEKQKNWTQRTYEVGDLQLFLKNEVYQ